MFHLLLQRGFWRFHIVVDIISLVSDLIEKLSAKCLEAGVSEVVFYLNIEGAHQVAVLVLTPFVHIFCLLKRDNLLPLEVFLHPFGEITITFFVFIH